MVRRSVFVAVALSMVGVIMVSAVNRNPEGTVHTDSFVTADPLAGFTQAAPSSAAQQAVSPMKIAQAASASDDEELMFIEYFKPPEMCFAPGTPDDVIERWNQFYLQQTQVNGVAYNAVDRWPGVMGSPHALTWSFIPDGVFIPAQIQGDSSGPSVLFQVMDAQFANNGGRAAWVSLFEQSFARWAELTGLSYTRITLPGVDWDDGAAWGSSGSSARGDVRIAMRNIDGSSGTLAFNNFPGSGSGGDMVLDQLEDWDQTFANFRFLRNVIMHEHGHGLGLAHVCSSNAAFLMEPLINIGIDGPRHDDMRGAQELYGDPFESDNSSSQATDTGVLEISSPITVGIIPPPSIASTSLLSIDTNGEQDWFRFTLENPREVDVSVVPAGFTYDDSNQNPNGSCACCNNITTINLADLAIEVRDSSGINILASSNATGAGQTEMLTVNLPDPGNYFVRVFETNSPFAAQSYRLDLAVSDIDPCFDVDCDDGVFCNGEEFCLNGECFPDEEGPCPGQCCEEDGDFCFDCGACCTPSGTCEVLTNFACNSIAGAYQGNGVECVDVDPPCEPADAVIACQLESAFVLAGSTVTVDTFLTDADNVGAYQVALEVSQISGTGSVSLDCTDCDGTPNVPECSVRIDDTRDDYLFEGLGTLGTVACPSQLLGAAVIGGGASAVGDPSYLGEFEFTVSPGATPGSTFVIEVDPNPDLTFLRHPNGVPIPYVPSLGCTLTVVDPGDCLTPQVAGTGSRTLSITPQGAVSQALRVTGDAGDSDVSCVDAWVQEDGSLGPTPVMMTPAQWIATDDGTPGNGSVGAFGFDIIPSATYNVVADCGGNVSIPDSGTTTSFADVDGNTVVNLQDAFHIVNQISGNPTPGITLDDMDIDPCQPNRVVNLGDALVVVVAISGSTYGDLCEAPCP